MRRPEPIRKQRWRQLLVLLLVRGLLGWVIFALLVNSTQAPSTPPRTLKQPPRLLPRPPPLPLIGNQRSWMGSSLIFRGRSRDNILPTSTMAPGSLLPLVYEEKPRASPLQHLEAETNILVSFSTKITDTNICPVRGTPVKLASGFVGRQQTNVPPTANGPAQSYPYVWLACRDQRCGNPCGVDGNDPANTFFARDGGIWQHILASLAPGSNNDAPPHNRPCG